MTWNLQKAADAQRIAARIKELVTLRGTRDDRAILALLAKHLPGAAQGRKSGWTTAEVLAAIDAAMKEPVA